MPGYPSAPTTLNITDKLASIAPSKGNVAGYYVWLVDPDAGQSAGDPHGVPGAGIYGPSSVTDSQGNWTINNVPGSSNYITFWGARNDRWEFPGVSPYVALNPAVVNAGQDIVVRSVTVGSSAPWNSVLPGAPSVATPAGVMTGRKLWEYGGGYFDSRAAGAKNDAQCITNGAITSGLKVLTSASNPFVAADVGKLVSVIDVAVGTATLQTTIASFQSAGQVTLTAAAAATMSGAVVIWGTDDTAANQATINAADAAVGVALISAEAPVGSMISAALTTLGKCDIIGTGVHELFGVQTSISVWIPQLSPWLSGSVLIQTASNTDVLQVITTPAPTPNYSGWGFSFTNYFKSTGHGISGIPPVLNAGKETGICSAHWDSIKGWGHDGNHYGIDIMNPLLLTIDHPRMYGGGGIRLNENSANLAFATEGNTVIHHPYCITFAGGSADALRFQTAHAGMLALITLEAPQGAVYNFALPGVTAPTSAQRVINCDPTVYSMVTSGVCDFETNVGSIELWPSTPTNPGRNSTSGGLHTGQDAANDPAGFFNPTSGTAYQNTTGTPVMDFLAIQMNPTGGAAATATLSISSTSGGAYTTVASATVPAAGPIGIETNLSCYVPAGYWLKTTWANATRTFQKYYRVGW